MPLPHVIWKNSSSQRPRLSSLACAEVSVAVLPDNHRAIKFYRMHGLTEEALYLEKHFVLERV